MLDQYVSDGKKTIHTTFVASYLPPNPTSMIATSTYIKVFVNDTARAKNTISSKLDSIKIQSTMIKPAPMQIF